MKIFSARFDLAEVIGLTSNTWQITGSVVDNSGNFFATDVQLDDVIYIDGNAFGQGILRYKVIDIAMETVGATLKASIEWDNPYQSAVQPYAGLAGIIGKTSNNLKLTALSNIFVNMANEGLISYARNYENQIILDNAMENFENKLGDPFMDGQVLSSKIDGTREWITLPSITDAITTAINDIKEQPNGLASLDENGKVPVGQIPAISITDIYTVNSELEMLALSVQKGDIAVRTDTGEQFILHAEPASILGNWTKISQPIPVTSVNGKNGAVVLTTSDINEGSNLYYTDERVANSPSVQNLQNAVNAAGDMLKSVYDMDNDGVVDKSKHAISADTATNIEWSGVNNKPLFATVATSGSYNDLTSKPALFSGNYIDLINKPTIPTATSNLTKDDVYTKLETDSKISQEVSGLIDDITPAVDKVYSSDKVDTLLSGASSVKRYDVNGDGACIILATGDGVQFSKIGNSCTITCPNGVQIITARIHFNGTEIGATANCTIDYGSNGVSFDGTGNNDNYTFINPPQYQVINDVVNSRAYKVLPFPAANLNMNAHTLQITGLTSNIGVWVKLVF